MRLIDSDAMTADILALRDCPNGNSDTYDKSCIIGIIEEQPTVEAPTWIPCNERLPESDEFVIITILDERGDAPYRYADFGWYLDVANCWIVDAEQRTDVIAWMPLPRAFKEKV